MRFAGEICIRSCCGTSNGQSARRLRCAHEDDSVCASPCAELASAKLPPTRCFHQGTFPGAAVAARSPPMFVPQLHRRRLAFTVILKAIQFFKGKFSLFKRKALICITLHEQAALIADTWHHQGWLGFHSMYGARGTAASPSHTCLRLPDNPSLVPHWAVPFTTAADF